MIAEDSICPVCGYSEDTGFYAWSATLDDQEMIPSDETCPSCATVFDGRHHSSAEQPLADIWRELRKELLERVGPSYNLQLQIYHTLGPAAWAESLPTYQVVVEEVVALSGAKPLTIYRTSTGCPICPVCGDVGSPGAEDPWLPSGTRDAVDRSIVVPSRSICRCCQTQYGEDDVPSERHSFAEAWTELREDWLAEVGRSEIIIEQLRRNLRVNV